MQVKKIKMKPTSAINKFSIVIHKKWSCKYMYFSSNLYIIFLLYRNEHKKIYYCYIIILPWFLAVNNNVNQSLWTRKIVKLNRLVESSKLATVRNVLANIYLMKYFNESFQNFFRWTSFTCMILSKYFDLFQLYK